MTTAQPVDRETFLARLRHSGLVTEEQLQTTPLPDSSRGRTVARALVDGGLLTKFQAEQLLVGRTGGFFLGQYRILEQIGQGGMGRVFKAEHRTMGRLVAIKVLSAALLKNERARDLFLREVRVGSMLVHPNVVTAFDANLLGDRYYLVMEYVNGPNLDQLVREKGPLPVAQACDFIRQAATGLQAAHQMGMVHRDVKPANLLLHRAPSDPLGTYGTLKISDFGLARLQDTSPIPEENVGTILTQANTVMGTPDYLSPEQARCLHQTDIRSDIYSLGCTMYFLLTGQLPFPGGTLVEKLIRQNTEEPVPVEQVRPDAPAEIAAVVRKLMAKVPGNRYQTPQEVADALAPFAHSSPAAWTPPPPPHVDPSPTPVARPSSDPFFPSTAPTDEVTAQVSTVLPDRSPTPISLVGPSATGQLSKSLAVEQERRIRVALAWAAAIVGGVLLLSLLASLILPA